MFALRIFAAAGSITLKATALAARNIVWRHRMAAPAMFFGFFWRVNCRMAGVAKPANLKSLRIVVVMAVRLFCAASLAGLANQRAGLKRALYGVPGADLFPVSGDRLILAGVSRSLFLGLAVVHVPPDLMAQCTWGAQWCQ